MCVGPTAFQQWKRKQKAYAESTSPFVNYTTQHLWDGRKGRLAASLFLHHNPLHHTLQHLVVELECLVSGELDIFGQVVR